MSGGRTIYRRRSRGRRVVAVVALVVAAGAVAAAATWLLIGQTGPAARDAADGFLAAWSRGDDRGAAALTDRPGPAAEVLAANRAGLDGATLRARLLDVSERDDTARARTELAWEVPGIGHFAYESTLSLRRADDRWTVTWSPAVVHPELDEDQRLGTTRSPATRGNILDRDGEAIVRNRTVYRVGLARDKVDDIGASTQALAGVIDIDPGPLARALRGAGPQQFVEAITLRESDYDAVKGALDGVPGVWRCATTRRWPRAGSSRGHSSGRSGRPRPSSSSSSRARAGLATRSGSRVCSSASRTASAARPPARW